MEEGTKSKKTVFVGGLGDDVDEAVIYETFSTFGISSTTPLLYALICNFIQTGDILEVQLPSAVVDPNRQNGQTLRIFIYFLHAQLTSLRTKTSGVRLRDLWLSC